MNKKICYFLFKNISNIITISRLILGLWGLWQYAYFSSSIGLLLYIFSLLADAIDGYVARKYNLESDFGRIIDPLVDKILIMSVYWYGYIIALIPRWVLWLIFTKEFLLIIGAGIFIMFYKRSNKNDIKEYIQANEDGKIAMMMYSFGALFILGNNLLGAYTLYRYTFYNILFGSLLQSYLAFFKYIDRITDY